MCAVFLHGNAGPALHRPCLAGHSGGCHKRARPGVAAFRTAWQLLLAAGWLLLGGRVAFPGQPGGCFLAAGRLFLCGRAALSWKTRSKQNMLCEILSAAFTMKISNVGIIYHNQRSHRGPTIGLFQQPTLPTLMQPDAGFMNHGQAT